MIGIYKITNNINGKCYIGKSEVSIEGRINYHKSRLEEGTHYNTHMQNSFNKYNGDFSYEIIEELDNRDDCCDREKYWIEYYKSSNPEYGFNMTKGGGVRMFIRICF